MFGKNTRLLTKLHDKNYNKIRANNLQKSRWGELNPRPIPYQGIAIPLSHSGKPFFQPDIEKGFF
jgi:hypothetical protein